MASKYSPQSAERNDKSRISLPCIGEDELLNQPKSSARGSIPKSPSKRRLRVNSEPIVPANSSEAKDSAAAVRSKDATDDVSKVGKVSSNQKSIARRVSCPVGVSTDKDYAQCNTKATKSKNAKQKVKPKAPSPDVIDLSNEDVVHELMRRLYQSLGIPDNRTNLDSPMKNTDSTVEGSYKQTKTTNLCKKTDDARKLSRHFTARLPQVNKITSNLEVFYSKPISWKTLVKSRQLYPKTRTKHYLAFQEVSTKANKPVKEKMLQTNENQLTWPMKRNCALAGRSTSVLRKRGLSEPFIVTSGSAFASSQEMFRRSFDSRKSVTFAE